MHKVLKRIDVPDELDWRDYGEFSIGWYPCVMLKTGEEGIIIALCAGRGWIQNFLHGRVQVIQEGLHSTNMIAKET